jgi:hypothetical protein
MRKAATGHPSAQYAFWVLPYSGRGTITLPAQAVVAGQQGSFAFDSQIAGTCGPAWSGTAPQARGSPGSTARC